MCDPRSQDKVRYTLPELLRERIFALALSASAQDDLDGLAHDPALRMATWDRPGEQVLDERLASQPTQSRLLDILASRSEHMEALRGALADWTERHLRSTGGDHAVRHGTLDIDSFPVAVAGRQPGGAYNGYYKETVYHPLLASFAVVELQLVIDVTERIGSVGRRMLGLGAVPADGAAWGGACCPRWAASVAGPGGGFHAAVGGGTGLPATLATSAAMENAARSIAPCLGSATLSRPSSLDVEALSCVLTRNHALGERGRCTSNPSEYPFLAVGAHVLTSFADTRSSGE